jgi:hypothetical protein
MILKHNFGKRIEKKDYEKSMGVKRMLGMINEYFEQKQFQ